MKTSLRRLRGVLHKHESKDRRDLRFLVQKDELAQASQVPIFISLSNSNSRLSTLKLVSNLGLRMMDLYLCSFVHECDCCFCWQDVKEMRDCYDSLLSAAAATANSAYGKILFFL